MTHPPRTDIPGPRDWTRDPGRRISTLAWEFHPRTLHAGRWPHDPETAQRLFADLAAVHGGRIAVGGIRDDDPTGQVVAVAFLVDGNAEARAETGPVAVEMLRSQLVDLAARGVRVATPAELLGSDPFARRVLTVSLQDHHRPPPAPAPGVLAALDVPAPIKDWHDLCDAWGVPRNPDALVRAVQAATWDRATTRYLADKQAAHRDHRDARRQGGGT